MATCESAYLEFDNDTFGLNVQARTEQFERRPRAQPELKRKVSRAYGEEVVYYDLMTGRFAGSSTIMTFDWRPVGDLRHRRGSRWHTMRVHVDIAGILGMQVVNGIVFAELSAAVSRDFITRDLAEDIWDRWCGSGEERMVYEMEECIHS